MDIPLILDRHFPGTSWSGSAADYSKLNWTDTVTPKPTLLELANLWSVIELDFAKSDKIQYLSLRAKNLIESGFPSSALGSVNYYDSAIEDQINLIGAVTSNVDLYYSTRASLNSAVKSYKLHTAAQIRQVMDDGKTFKAGILMKFDTLRTQVQNCTNLTSVANVVW